MTEHRCEKALTASKFVYIFNTQKQPKLADGIGRMHGSDTEMLIIESSG